MSSHTLQDDAENHIQPVANTQWTTKEQNDYLTNDHYNGWKGSKNRGTSFSQGFKGWTSPTYDICQKCTILTDLSTDCYQNLQI